MQPAAIASIEFSRSDAKKVVGRIAAVARPSDQLLDDVGRVLEDSAVERISDSNKGPDGQTWRAWSDAYAEWRSKRGGDQTLLRLEGHLQQSITHNVIARGVEVGSNLIYAATHQFGRGKIPARPYLGVSDRDERRILRIVEAAVKGQLEGGAP